MNKIRTVFFGTPSFAVPSLEKLCHDDRYEVIAVVSQAEKPVGRDQTVQKSPIASMAEEKGIETYLPATVRSEDVEKWMKDKAPDICIVVAYGKIIPQNILDIPTYGFINIHGSLLPKYRGASPIQYALLNGEKQTGITFMVMNEKMDEGDILFQAEEAILATDTYQTLGKKLSVVGANYISDIVDKYIRKEIMPVPQQHAEATYTKIIEKEMGKIDWQAETAEQIINKLRAFTPWPGIYTFFNGKRLKILEATFSDFDNSRFSQGFLSEQKHIQTISGIITPVIVQPEGKKPMRFEDFLRGVKKENIHFT